MVICCGFDDGNFAQVHRNAVVGDQRNADFYSIAGLLLVERLEHVLHFGDDEVKGVPKDAVGLFQSPGDDPFGKVTGLVNSSLERRTVELVRLHDTVKPNR